MKNVFNFKPKEYLAIIFLLVFLSSCAILSNRYEKQYGPEVPQNRILIAEELTLDKPVSFQDPVSFQNKVQPILSQRCAVCHSCNDAPCQLNLTSIEGIDRGLNKVSVYNGVRFTQQEPSRLGIDASSTAEWREQGFLPVLNERRQNKQINLDNSLLFKTLKAKRIHSFPTEGALPESYEVGSNIKVDKSFVHAQVCPDIETYDGFIHENPQFGMPFALPALTNKEFLTISNWLEQGAKSEPGKELSKDLQQAVQDWENFFAGANNKEQLMSRYIYEHLFQAHIYFDDISSSDFFEIVRSKTPSGQPIDIINTRRPYNDPGVEKFYYRLKYYNRVIVDKTHLPYALNNNRMERYRSLFLHPEYTVSELPSYETVLAANPFKTFEAIPAKSRYQFMLDEAHFFVGGFIKGSVCRGSIALGVIDDHFWVTFMDPEKSYFSHDSEFLAKMSEHLRLPAEMEDKAKILSNRLTYQKHIHNYIVEKIKYQDEQYKANPGVNIEHIWNGGQTNPNASLTVYRHYDSATVLKGLIGEIPKTGWVMDFPIFERIHYLLVAGFDVYGKAGHQLSTRLYMDYLRFESELEFLSFLPLDQRQNIHEYWYRGTDVTKNMLKNFSKLDVQSRETQIKFHTDDVKKEFFSKLAQHLPAEKTGHANYLNLCADFVEKCKNSDWLKNLSPAGKALVELASIKGKRTLVFPNVTFVRVIMDGSIENDRVFTIVRNKAYLNTMSLTVNEKIREPEKDSIDLIPGFVGAYPNFFLEVNFKDIKKFVDEYKAIDDKAKYAKLIDNYGIRRTNPEFWRSSDWFYKKHQHDNPVTYGLFDLNRYNNR